MLRRRVFAFWGLGLLATEAQPKIAYIDMDRVLRNHYQKAYVEAEAKKQIDALATDPRVLAVQELDAKLKNLAAQVRDSKLPEAQRSQAAEEFNSLSIEYPGLLGEMETLMATEKKKATLYLVKTIEDILKEVGAVVASEGEAGGYDLVFERGGKSSSQVSPIIYLRGGTDLTEQVLAKLNANAPAPEKTEETEASGENSETEPAAE